MFFNKTIYCNKGFDYSIFGMCFNVNVLCALHFRTSLIALHVQRKTFTDKLSCRCATVVHLMETTLGVCNYTANSRIVEWDQQKSYDSNNADFED